MSYSKNIFTSIPAEIVDWPTKEYLENEDNILISTSQLQGPLLLNKSTAIVLLTSATQFIYKKYLSSLAHACPLII